MEDIDVCILWTLGLFYGYVFDIFYGHLEYLVVIWNIFPRFGILYQKIWQPCYADTQPGQVE
jgi:hypothetical protein